jgi:N-acetylglucosaminyldiphosphoundecaprenol N-acetyl-beta-D-mannosaminyltransferase
MKSESLHLLGVRFDNLTTTEAADRIEHLISNGHPSTILARNAAIRVLEDGDPWLRQLYERSDLVTVDGMAFVYLARILGFRFKEMTGGPALWYEILRRAAIKNYGVYLLGSTELILQQAISNLQKVYLGLRVVGHHHGYFRSDQEEHVVEDIRRLRPEILMIGMSSPLKEKFLQRNLSRMGVPACIGIGGAIDLFAGEAKLAPMWMRKACMEWLYRVCQEPGRLAKRYLHTNSRFLFLVAKEIATAGNRTN